MKNYQKSDYAQNKHKNGIVYTFQDGSRTEISLEEYLKENPDKTEQDFIRLKSASDEIYHMQVMEENRYSWWTVPLEKLGEPQQPASPDPCMQAFQHLEEEDALTAAALLLQQGGLTEIQKRRFILHFFHGASYRQIAKSESVYYTSVRDSIELAVKKLKKIFKNLENRYRTPPL